MSAKDLEFELLKSGVAELKQSVPAPVVAAVAAPVAAAAAVADVPAVSDSAFWGDLVGSMTAAVARAAAAVPSDKDEKTSASQRDAVAAATSEKDWEQEADVPAPTAAAAAAAVSATTAGPVKSKRRRNQKWKLTKRMLLGTNLASCKAPIEKLIRNIDVECASRDPMRFSVFALQALQVSLEAIVVDRLEGAMVFAKAAVPNGMPKGVLLRHWRSSCSRANDWYSPEYNGVLLPQIIKASDNKFNPLCDVTLDGKNVFEENERFEKEYAEDKGIPLAPPTLVHRPSKNIQEGFTDDAIQRMAKRAKCSGISTAAYSEIRSFSVMYLEMVLKGLRALLDSTKNPRHTVYCADVIYIMDTHRRKLAGFGVGWVKPKARTVEEDGENSGDETEEEETGQPSKKKTTPTPPAQVDGAAAAAAASSDV